MATDNSSWIRKYLQDRGFADKDIGYDKTSGAVTYQGKDFIKPEKSVGGKSFASNDSLNSAFNNYNTTQNQVTINDLLKQYTDGLQGSTVQPFQSTVQAPTREQFQYNAESDPQYQAALRRAQDNAAQASRQSQEELNARGILNSTVTSDRDAQIKQSELGRVTDNVLPQLMQQAYQRYNDDYAAKYQDYMNQYGQQYQNYTDQYNQGQDKFKNLQSLIPIISGENQHAIDNQFRKETDTRNFNYGVGRDKVKDAQFKQEFNQRVKQDGIQAAISWANNSISQQNANTSAASLAWSKDPNNPDNIYKNKQIDLLGKETPEYKGLSANQVFDSIRSTYTEPIYAPAAYPGAQQQKIGDKMTADPAKREQMFLNVIDAGLGTDAETRQVLSLLGLTKKEIDQFTKKYGG